MKTILTTAQARQWLKDNWSLAVIQTDWTKGGQYGAQCRILNARADAVTKSTGGSGYDKSGVALAMFITDTFPAELKEVGKVYGQNTGSLDTRGKGLYGLSVYPPKGSKKRTPAQRYAREGDKVGINGMCGFGSMQDILQAVGFAMVRVCETKTGSVYRLVATADSMKKGR